MQPDELTTKAEYDRLRPRAQGYVQYWEGDQPGSELRNLANPDATGSKNHGEWNLGQQLAVQDAQDSEE